MKFHIAALGLTLAAGLATAASAQTGDQNNLGSGTAVPDATVPLQGNSNPFSAAAGSDRFYDDNSLSGAMAPRSANPDNGAGSGNFFSSMGASGTAGGRTGGGF